MLPQQPLTKKKKKTETSEINYTLFHKYMRFRLDQSHTAACPAWAGAVRCRQWLPLPDLCRSTIVMFHVQKSWIEISLYHHPEFFRLICGVDFLNFECLCLSLCVSVSMSRFLSMHMCVCLFPIFALMHLPTHRAYIHLALCTTVIFLGHCAILITHVHYLWVPMIISSFN